MTNQRLDSIERTVCGVGYKENILTTEPNGSRKPYSVWKNMIHRCYSKTHPSYRFYGERGVTVSESWHCYNNFRGDIEKLEGYDEDLFYKNELELDKDELSGESKSYSKETCRWVSREENLSLVKRSEYLPHLTKTRLVALSPSDEVYCIINVPMFVSEYELFQAAIYGTLSDKGSKTHRGWCFKRVVDFDKVATIYRVDYEQTRHGVIPLKYEVLRGEEVIAVLNDVYEASEYMKCSISNINQRTRNGQQYSKHGVILRRKI